MLFLKPRSMIAALAAMMTLIAGCGAADDDIRPYSTTMPGPANEPDRRMTDPNVLMNDMLLRKGDLGIDLGERGGFRAMNNRGPQRVWPSPGLADDPRTAVRNVIATASTYYGTPYEFGSDRSEPSTFDCSDFTRWVYLFTLGMDLPLDSRSQAEYVRRYSARSYTNIREARPGDLLFFTAYNGIAPENYPASRDLTISHTGVYIGGGKMIHTASAKTGGVRIDPVVGNHLEYRFVVGGSVLE